LRPIKDYLTLETNSNFLISIYVYPQTITITLTKHCNTHRHKQGLKSSGDNSNDKLSNNSDTKDFDFITKPRGIIVLISEDNHQNVLIISNSTLKY